MHVWMYGCMYVCMSKLSSLHHGFLTHPLAKQPPLNSGAPMKAHLDRSMRSLRMPWGPNSAWTWKRTPWKKMEKYVDLFNWKVWYDLILFPNGSKCLLKMLLLLKMMFVWNSCCEILRSFRWVKTRAFQPWKLVFLLKLVLFGEFTRDCFSVFSVGLVNVALESKNESLLLRQGDGATNRSKDKTVHFANCSKSTRFQERDPSILSIYLLISTDTLYKHIWIYNVEI